MLRFFYMALSQNACISLKIPEFCKKYGEFHGGVYNFTMCCIKLIFRHQNFGLIGTNPVLANHKRL